MRERGREVRGVSGRRGGSRRWPSRVEVARAAASWCPSSWQGGRRHGRGGAAVGWAVGGAGPGKWHQVGGPGGLLSLSIYFFSISVILFLI